MRKNIYERIYDKLEKLGLNMVNPPQRLKSESNGYMDLNYELLEDESGAGYVISLSHYYTENYDPIPDPDMTIRIYPETKQAEALTYRDLFGAKEVYPAPGKFYPKVKKDLNSFLDTWVSNLINQGHSLKEAH